MKDKAKDKSTKPAVKVQDLKAKANPTGGAARTENAEHIKHHQAGLQKQR